MGKSEASKFAKHCRRKNFLKRNAWTMCIPLFILILMVVIPRMCFPGQQAEIEQLRKDVKAVVLAQQNVPKESIAKIIQWNTVISSHRRYNNIWWSDIFHHNGWNDIKLIKIPKC